jgi:hypothetical protein
LRCETTPQPEPTLEQAQYRNRHQRPAEQAGHDIKHDERHRRVRQPPRRGMQNGKPGEAERHRQRDRHVEPDEPRRAADRDAGNRQTKRNRQPYRQTERREIRGGAPVKPETREHPLRQGAVDHRHDHPRRRDDPRDHHRQACGNLVALRHVLPGEPVERVADKLLQSGLQALGAAEQHNSGADAADRQRRQPSGEQPGRIPNMSPVFTPARQQGLPNQQDDGAGVQRRKDCRGQEIA